jgi:hypothetical protein
LKAAQEKRNMTKTIVATYDGCVLRLEEPLSLPANTRVQVTLALPDEETLNLDELPGDPFEGIEEDTGIADLAEHFDDYRFGRRVP